MIHTTENCGCAHCCEGVEVVTPQQTMNRPGLTALSYRVGTYATFLESMLARLSSKDYPKLAELTTREKTDASIALMDAWSTVGDVLTFYNERIINEAYLRTATDRRSILELARLVGYQLRPGVASSVYLAYNIDQNFKEEVTIPKGARSQSIPGPGELPQSFEISEDLKARAKWNSLQARLSRPQTVFSILLNPKGPRIYLKGTQTNLKPNDPLLLDFSGNNQPIFYRIDDVIPDLANDRTLVKIQQGKLGEKLVFEGDDPFEIIDKYKDIKHFLLDDGKNLTEFFSLISKSEDGLKFDLISINNLIHSMLELRFDEETKKLFIELQNDSGNSAFFVEKIEVLELPTSKLKYLRLSLQRLNRYDRLVQSLMMPPFTQLKNELQLSRKIKDQFFDEFIKSTDDSKKESESELGVEWLWESIRSSLKPFSTGSVGELTATADGNNALLKAFSPLLSNSLANANSNADVTGANAIKVYAFSNKAAPFGYNAPPRQQQYLERRKFYSLSEWKINDPLNERIFNSDDEPEIIATNFHKADQLYLDNEYEIKPDSWVAIENHNYPQPIVIKLDEKNTIQQTALTAYGLSGKSTLLNLEDTNKWVDEVSLLQEIRNTRVYIQSEELELAEEPLVDPVFGGMGNPIELNDYLEDLQSGRWVLVSGERADIAGTSDVRSSELAMISVVKHDVSHQKWEGSKMLPDFRLPGDKLHTFIEFDKPLKYSFKRETITINANVVKATHGETRTEVLGSGNGAQALQSFTLKQPPLTYVSAANPSGIDSTLQVFVNDVKWHEANALAGLAANDRKFITKTNNEGKTTVSFGNGREGARLPTGIENIKAQYRNGIGKAGNVKAEQISLLVSRPLGVKEVINPIRASGGADKETRDQARKNAPLAVKALDRLVSVQDYEDFTRTYPGIGKASAAELSDGRRQIVYITIAGVEDAPIEKHSDLYRNLKQTLHDFGDPYQAIQLELRELLLLVLSAKIKIQADYQWEPVVTQIRITLLSTFSFESRELGQDVMLSEVISVIQNVRGVAYVDVDVFGGVPEKKLSDDKASRQLLTPADIAKHIQEKILDKPKPGRLNVNLADFEGGMIHPAQIAYFTPDVPATLILNQIP